MSNALAIAAVTLTLRSLLTRAVDGGNVTTLPPDKARKDATDQVNLFLYNAAIDAALRNEPPRTAKPGESAEPSLPLRLHYLVTAYGEGESDALGHKLLGQAMGALHDHPLLGSEEIREVTQGNGLGESDLHTQVERIRITPHSMNVEEMSKLWTTFMTPFRASAAYEVSVVLIDSRRPARAALPVIGRGSRADTGIESTANVDSPFPSLSSVETPDPSALIPGETLVLRGSNLSGETVGVRVRHQLMQSDRVLAPLAGATASEVRVVLPDEPANLPAGFYTVAVEVGTKEAAHGDTLFTRTTNRLAFAVAPSITSPMPVEVARGPEHFVSFTLTCGPQVQAGQRASLMLGDREIPPLPFDAPTDTLDFSFEFDGPVPAESFARLRVDGVDSLLVNRAADPPVFLGDRKVKIT